jgi:hypothetical protein
MNRYIVSAVALMASAGIAFAQSPKGQDASPPAAQGQTGSGGSSGVTSPGSSGTNAPGTSKSAEPGQVKEKGSSATNEGAGRTKSQNRVESEKESDTKSKSKSSQRDDATKSKRSKNADRDDAEKSGKSAERDDADKRGKSADRNERSKDGKSAERNGAEKDMKSSSGSRNGDTPKRAGREGGGKSGASAEIRLQPEQKTKVVTTFKRHRVEPTRDININVSVGTVVPRKVHLHPIPQDIVVIVPEYRRYKYFIYEDRVIIVEPATYEIVDVLILA